jgi:hypothetical protein
MKHLWMVAAGVVLVSGCKKEPEKTPQELLRGRWTVESSEILGSVVPGDGSYMEFNACPSACSGTDFKASDTTTGNFTYIMNTEATLLTITDTSSNGGAWNGAWDILELSENELRITTSTVFGSMKVTFSK